MAPASNIFATTTVTYSSPTTPTMANPNNNNATEVKYNEGNWVSWIRQYQEVFVQRNENDDHRRMGRRYEIASALQEAGTQDHIAKRVLDMQARHYDEDQKIGATRYEADLRAHRKFFIHLVRLSFSESYRFRSLKDKDSEFPDSKMVSEDAHIYQRIHANSISFIGQAMWSKSFGTRPAPCCPR